MDDVITHILGELEPAIIDYGTEILASSKIPLLKDKFFKFSTQQGKIGFVDGGNAELLGAANFSLQLMRVYYTLYTETKREEQKRYQFYALITSNKGSYDVKFFGDIILKEFTLDQSDEHLKQGKQNGEISRVGDMVRRFAELTVAKELVPKADCVIIDGNLDSTFTKENELLKSLKETADEHNVSIGGLAKTCDLLTDTGNSAIGALADLEPEGSWYYNSNPSFVKLHPDSKYIFRLDYHGELDKLVSLLQQHSCDPVFLGYPYGLIEADQFARVSHSEKRTIQTELMMKAGDRWKTISQFLTTKNSHQILDTIK
jgi:hypothetical protein